MGIYSTHSREAVTLHSHHSLHLYHYHVVLSSLTLLGDATLDLRIRGAHFRNETRLESISPSLAVNDTEQQADTVQYESSVSE